MSLDFASIVLALSISVLSFLAVAVYAKKQELSYIKTQLKPIVAEARKILIRNFLSLNKVPSKSEIISILSGIANRYDVQILSYYPMHEIIDDLVYSVISNDLLDSAKKESISTALLKLKNEPMSSEDYVYIVSEIEKSDEVKQRAFYSVFMTTLIVSAITTVTLAIPFVQYRSLWGVDVIYFADMAMVASIGFTVLSSLVAIWYITQSMFTNFGTRPKTLEQRKAMFSLNKLQINSALNKTTTEPALSDIVTNRIGEPSHGEIQSGHDQIMTKINSLTTEETTTETAQEEQEVQS